MDTIEVKRFFANAHIPQKMSPGSAGFDLYALKDEDIPPQTTLFIRTGINICVPEGYYGAIKGRSGNAFIRNMFVFNDVINTGYQDEIAVLIMNFNVSTTLHIKEGERIAQIILTKIHPSHQIAEAPEHSKEKAYESASKSNISTTADNADTQKIYEDDDTDDDA